MCRKACVPRCPVFAASDARTSSRHTPVYEYGSLPSLMGLAKIQSSVAENSECCFQVLSCSRRSLVRLKVRADPSVFTSPTTCSTMPRRMLRFDPSQSTSSHRSARTSLTAHADQGHLVEWLTQLLQQSMELLGREAKSPLRQRASWFFASPSMRGRHITVIALCCPMHHRSSL